jgi:hypothetical protein
MKTNVRTVQATLLYLAWLKNRYELALKKNRRRGRSVA